MGGAAYVSSSSTFRREAANMMGARSYPGRYSLSTTSRKMRLLPVVFLALITSWTASRQTYTISTLAGGGVPGSGFSGDNGQATSAQLNSPWGVAVDSAGSLYIADYYNNRIRKVSNGIITTVAGNGAGAVSGVGNFASSGKSVGDSERQRAASVRNRRNLRQVESNDLCSSSPP